MSRDSVLAQGRSRKNELMSETVRIVNRVEATDDDSLDVSDDDTDVRYDGPARYKAAGRQLSEDDGAGQPVVTQQAVLELPTGTAVMGIDLVVIIDASIVDEALVGVEQRIADRPERGQTTSLRYPLKELNT